ncbi:unnamed protein product, partial [Mesorhabditis belari]|uniref:Uncharacterized protein n=1 Tax=Mesorhabditis belari TaxID=2138241 RepID=A0AAF3ETZ3_9BILA
MGDVAVSPPISPPHNINHKRVSFGENNVKTFVYEKEIIQYNQQQPPPPKQPFTDPTAPATRVRVTAENSSEPRPIAPPTEVEEDGRRPTSPPLRSYKMEEHENPFKPQDLLYHEVDPIVEQYLHKPFPPSHSGSVNNTPVKHSSNGHHSPEELEGRLHESARPITPPSIRESPAYYQNGLTRADIVAEKQHKESASQPLIDTPGRRSEDRGGHAIGKQQADSELPPAGQVEMVHIKKKKCGCCSLQ